MENDFLISHRTFLIQYPDEPPQIDLIDSKGLDEQRQKKIIVSLKDRAQQLSSCLMLVALCEVYY